MNNSLHKSKAKNTIQKTILINLELIKIIIVDPTKRIQLLLWRIRNVNPIFR